MLSFLCADDGMKGYECAICIILVVSYIVIWVFHLGSRQGLCTTRRRKPPSLPMQRNHPTNMVQPISTSHARTGIPGPCGPGGRFGDPWRSAPCLGRHRLRNLHVSFHVIPTDINSDCSDSLAVSAAGSLLPTYSINNPCPAMALPCLLAFPEAIQPI